MKAWIRVWQEKELTEVEKHLLIVGDTLADCGQCRELGLDYRNATRCPKCGTTFSYITSRRFESHPSERFHIVKRLSQTRSDLVWIDYDDYRKITGRQKALDFFKD